MIDVLQGNFLCSELSWTIEDLKGQRGILAVQAQVEMCAGDLQPQQQAQAEQQKRATIDA